MALDEPKDSDETFNASGYDFIVDKELASQAGQMTVDMTYMGFTIHSNMQFASSGGCGSSCSSGSCSC